MEQIAIQATKREVSGKRVKSLRTAGKLPAVLYGHNTKTTQLEVSEKDFAILEGKEFERLGSGEKECMALCKQHQNSVLLINDNKARKVAGKKGIVVLNISAFLLACKKTMFLEKNKIAVIMKDLKQKDYYEFGEDEKKELLTS